MYKQFDTPKKVATPANKGERVYSEFETQEEMDKHLLKNNTVTVTPDTAQSFPSADKLLQDAEIDLDDLEQYVITSSFK